MRVALALALALATSPNPVDVEGSADGTEEQAAEYFKRADANGDGTLSEGELTTYLTEQHRSNMETRAAGLRKSLDPQVDHMIQVRALWWAGPLTRNKNTRHVAPSAGQ